MALHLNLVEHEMNPPSSWIVRKNSPKRWQLVDRSGAVIETFSSKELAERATVSGRLVDLYEKEGRWFRGEVVEGWKPYVVKIT